MAKENVAKFFEKLATDKALAEKLAAADKAYAEKHQGQVIDDATKKAATEAVVLPVAKEAGVPFTLDEFMVYEKEKAEEFAGEVSDEEMANAAGGKAIGIGAFACYYMGIGAADISPKKANTCNGLCLVVGISNGANAGACFFAGAAAREDKYFKQDDNMREF